MLLVHRQQPPDLVQELRAVAQQKKEREQRDDKVHGEQQHVLRHARDL